MPVKLCQDPTSPHLSCSKTKLFGVPRGKTGRDGIPILGIAIHCIEMEAAAFNDRACTVSPNLLGCDHASMHYVVDGTTGQINCQVPEPDVAWGFQTYTSNMNLPNALQPYPGWPVLSALYPNHSADFYVLNIGIASPTQPEVDVLERDDCCRGPYGMTWEAYENFVRLLAWLAFRYDIPIDAQHISLHQDIVEVKMGCEECRCLLTCLLCDISNYCETCTNAGDPSYIEFNELDYIYGEFRGCKAKMSVAAFVAKYLEDTQ